MARNTTRSARRRVTAPASPAARVTTDTAATPVPGASPICLEPEKRQSMISEAAYYLAQRRGFGPGCEVDDWLAAESEIDRALTTGTAGDARP